MTVRPQDLGGRHGFGPVQIEQDEPVFHADWEASVIAGILATISAGLYNVDQFRDGSKSPVLWPPQYKNGSIIYPYADARKK